MPPDRGGQDLAVARAQPGDAIESRKAILDMRQIMIVPPVGRIRGDQFVPGHDRNIMRAWREG
jgi:hypothetical protein